MKKIAVIGAGIMGSGIASNYLKAGYEVSIWNRTKERVQGLIDRGAVFEDTPRQAAEMADIVFEVSANDESSRSIWLGEDGILAGASKESVLIASATLSVPWIDELNGKCVKSGYTFFDMPLTGGRVGAEKGELILLAGGDQTILENLKPDLAAISKEVLYFGGAGSGMRYKLILNAVQAIHICALGEALKIARESGLDVARVGEALSERPGGTTTKLAWRDYQQIPSPINFSVEWITKDLSYASQLAEKLDTPLLKETLARYRDAMTDGMKDEDWTAVNREK